MTNLVFVVGILFGLMFVISPSEEIEIFPPPQGSTFVVAPGTSRVEISWTFNDSKWLKIIYPIIRQWVFVTTTELLAQIYEKESVTEYNSSLPQFEIVKPATLVLKNVDDRYNGTYELCVMVWYETRFRVDVGRSYVSVFVEAKPNVTISCSSFTTVNEGDDVRCLCKGEGGNPPANVTWYKDGVQIGIAGYEKKVLTINNIDKTASGIYKCVAQSYTLKDEKSIEIFVHHTLPPKVKSFTSIPENSMLGQSVVITCEATAVPVPSYTIIHNNTEVVSTEDTYIINAVKYSDAGLYECIAKNKLAQSSKNCHLSVVDTLPPRVKSFTSTPENSMLGQSVVIVCEAIAVPVPSYTIIHNDTEVVSTENTYIINVVKYSDAGSYKCIAKNKLGQSSKNYHLSVVETDASNKSNGGTVWSLILVSLLLGIVIGIIFSFIFVHSRRQSRNFRKPHSSYQDLDVGKMNSNGHYQSLRNDSDASDGDYVIQDDSIYTNLNNDRDVDNNYQSLI